nr:hypothetical protein [Suaeda aralocaspica]
MDIDLMRSAPDDQIELMMLMHMNKSAAPDFQTGGGGSSYADTTPLMSFSGGGGDGNIHGSLSHVFNTMSNSSPTISFSNNNNNNNDNHTNNNMLLPTTYGNSCQNNTSSHNNNSESNNFNDTCYPPSASGVPSSNKQTSMAAMREMIFRIAAMQPIYIDPEAVKPPKRRNVRISKDPQSVAARHRRERISERIRILQRLVPGGTKMDTASMLDEAIHYVKFLKTQVQSLERVAATNTTANNNYRLPPPLASTTGAGMGYFPITTRGATSQNSNVQR